MRKLLIPCLLLLLIISGCGSKTIEKNDKNGNEEASENKSGTIIYESENGPIKVPADPKRVVVLSSFAGNVMSLGVNLVGVDSWSKMNPRFDDKLKNVEEVSDESLEKNH